MDSAVELHLRQLIFERLADIMAEDGVLSRAELERLHVGDQHWRVIDRNRGIRNRKELLATLS
jgi:putative restriction endonuclease